MSVVGEPRQGLDYLDSAGLRNVVKVENNSGYFAGICFGSGALKAHRIPEADRVFIRHAPVFESRAQVGPGDLVMSAAVVSGAREMRYVHWASC